MKIALSKQKAVLRLPGKRGGGEGVREKGVTLHGDSCQLVILRDQEVSPAEDSSSLSRCFPSLSSPSVRGTGHNLLMAGVRGCFPPASSPGKVIPAARPDNSG